MKRKKKTKDSQRSSENRKFQFVEGRVHFIKGFFPFQCVFLESFLPVMVRNIRSAVRTLSPYVPYTQLFLTMGTYCHKQTSSYIFYGCVHFTMLQEKSRYVKEKAANLVDFTHLLCHFVTQIRQNAVIPLSIFDMINYKSTKSV